MRIALDTMGGDHAPAINLDGAAAALEECPGMQLVLVGPPGTVGEDHERLAASDRVARVESDGYVGMEEKPVEALRAKPNSSIAACWKLLAGREVDASISAGNTGAVVAAGLRTRLYLKGVKRPGIAVPLPTMSGHCILMDAGANPACRPEHLFQYAQMGAIYAKALFNLDRQPTCGLINIGGEVGKGNELVNETHDLIERAEADGKLVGSYVGNVEGRELFAGQADVVICDGFVGNVLLKASEGMAAMMMQKFGEHAVGALGINPAEAKSLLGKFACNYRYNEIGGAPLLGVDGLCMISHGSSDSDAIKNALLTAYRLGQANLNEQIVESLA